VTDTPDGRQIVFGASGDGASRLWLRSLATAQPLAGTEGAVYPFWSPDSRSIGFFAGSALKRLDLGGGAPLTLAPATNGLGGTWSADGVILFAPQLNSPVLRVSATGGATTTVTTIGPQQTSHVWPRLLPDGHRFLFYAPGGTDTAGIYLATLDGNAPTRLTLADSAGVYRPADAPGDSGWLLWERAGTLVAQRLDLAQAALTGDQGDRGRDLPVLVARQPLGGVLCRGPAEASRPRRGQPANRGCGRGPPRRDVECRRRDSVRGS